MQDVQDVVQMRITTTVRANSPFIQIEIVRNIRYNGTLKGKERKRERKKKIGCGLARCVGPMGGGCNTKKNQPYTLG